MFKFGKKAGLVGTVIGFLLLCLYGDFEHTKRIEGDLRRQLATHDIIGGLADNVQVGMDRAMVESLIAGWRSTSLFEAEGRVTRTYRYWYGVLPPLPLIRYKTTGKISVTYDGDDKVAEVRHWTS